MLRLICKLPADKDNGTCVNDARYLAMEVQFNARLETILKTETVSSIAKLTRTLAVSLLAIYTWCFKMKYNVNFYRTFM